MYLSSHYIIKKWALHHLLLSKNSTCPLLYLQYLGLGIAFYVVLNACFRPRMCSGLPGSQPRRPFSSSQVHKYFHPGVTFNRRVMSNKPNQLRWYSIFGIGKSVELKTIKKLPVCRRFIICNLCVIYSTQFNNQIFFKQSKFKYFQDNMRIIKSGY